VWGLCIYPTLIPPKGQAPGRARPKLGWKKPKEKKKKKKKKKKNKIISFRFAFPAGGAWRLLDRLLGGIEREGRDTPEV
jgi:hypothetical protein